MSHPSDYRRYIASLARTGICLLVGVTGTVAYVSKSVLGPEHNMAGAATSFVRPATTTTGYVGSSACAACHRAIYEKFLRSDMGRSMAPVTPALLQTIAAPSSVHDEKLGRHFDVDARDGKLYLAQW